MSGFTKEIIAKTFTEILDEKPMSKVTVRDIVERCGVNRNTFYYHFRDIPDVVEFILKKKWDELQEAPQEKNSILECMEEMASLARDNRKLMLNAYKSVKRDTFLIYMNDVILYIITEYFKKNRNKFQLEENEIQILIRYYKCLFVGILIEWLDHGLAEDLGTEMHQACLLYTSRCSCIAYPFGCSSDICITVLSDRIYSGQRCTISVNRLI